MDRTREDGADLGPMLSKLFEVLDTPGPERGKQLDAGLARLDYINGELFLAAEKKAGARHAKTANACRF